MVFINVRSDFTLIFLATIAKMLIAKETNLEIVIANEYNMEESLLRVGRTVNLTCSTQRNVANDIKFKWILPWNETPEVSEHFEPENIESTVIIKNITAKHEGKYSCSIKDPTGKISESLEFTLNIKSNKNKEHSLEVTGDPSKSAYSHYNSNFEELWTREISTENKVTINISEIVHIDDKSDPNAHQVLRTKRGIKQRCIRFPLPGVKTMNDAYALKATFYTCFNESTSSDNCKTIESKFNPFASGKKFNDYFDLLPASTSIMTYRISEPRPLSTHFVFYGKRCAESEETASACSTIDPFKITVIVPEKIQEGDDFQIKCETNYCLYNPGNMEMRFVPSNSSDSAKDIRCYEWGPRSDMTGPHECVSGKSKAVVGSGTYFCRAQRVDGQYDEQSAFMEVLPKEE